MHTAISFVFYFKMKFIFVILTVFLLAFSLIAQFTLIQSTQIEVSLAVIEAVVAIVVIVIILTVGHEATEEVGYREMNPPEDV